MTEVSVHIAGASGHLFQIHATTDNDQLVTSRSTLVASGILNASGGGTARFVMPAGSGAGVSLFGLYRGQNGMAKTATQGVNPEGAPARCQQLDFDYFVGPVADPVAGELMGGQWSLVGLAISATNNALGHPDKAIIFDSSNPTGKDFDLATPGPGQGNTRALGNLLIIAENDIDLNGDDIVDDPDDEDMGGVLRFSFDEPSTVCRAVILDIDDTNSSEMRFTHSNLSVTTIPVDNLGNNSVQTLDFAVDDVMIVEIVFGGSGAVSEIWATPCPTLVNLDENSYGVPLDIEAGDVLTDQFQSLGLTVSAVNGTIGHPDKMVIFNSEDPTGGDDDLLTPGPGVNNDTPLGLVVVIAENDIDLNGDGLIDDPDDEEFGGTMTFEFEADVDFFDATLLDVDAAEFDLLNFYGSSNALITSIQINSLGENSVQRLALAQPIPNVRRLEIILSGSGAVTRLRWCLSN